MAYNETTKTISAPVSIADVQRALGEATGDLMTLATSERVNAWSKHKPVSVTAPNASVAQKLATVGARSWKGYKSVDVDKGKGYWRENGFRAEMVETELTEQDLIAMRWHDRFGATLLNIYRITDSDVTPDFASSLPSASWVRVLPDVGRLTDFVGYRHDAPAPVWWKALDGVTVRLTDERMSKDGKVIAWGFLDEYTASDSEQGGLTLADFGTSTLEDLDEIGLVLYVHTSKGHFLLMSQSGGYFTRPTSPLSVTTDLLTMVGEEQDKEIEVALMLGTFIGKRTAESRLWLMSAKFTAAHETMKTLQLEYVGKILKVVYHFDFTHGTWDDNVAYVSNTSTIPAYLDEENKQRIEALLGTSFYANEVSVARVKVGGVLRISQDLVFMAELRNPYGVTLPPNSSVKFEFVMEDEVHDYAQEVTPTYVFGSEERTISGKEPSNPEHWQVDYVGSISSSPIFSDERNNKIVDDEVLHLTELKKDDYEPCFLVPICEFSKYDEGRYEGAWEINHVSLILRFRVRATITLQESGETFLVTSVPVNGNGKTDYRLDGEFNKLRQEGFDDATRSTLAQMDGTGGYMLAWAKYDDETQATWQEDRRNGTYYRSLILNDSGAFVPAQNGYGTKDWLPWAHIDDEGDAAAEKNFDDKDLYR